MPIMADYRLREYQHEGADHLVRAGRAILADEPGLGKTAQALTAARELGVKRVLVVGPKTSAGVWDQESKIWYPELHAKGVHYYQGTKRKQLGALGAIEGLVITNYSLLKEVLQGQFWPLIIWDESHKLKNVQRRNGKYYGTLFPVAKRMANCRYQFFLTGSPIRHSAGDLWTTLHLISPTRWPSYWTFVEKYCVVWRDEFGMHVEGVRNEDALRADLKGIMLRRLKADKLPGLPPKQRQFIPLEMEPKQRKGYEELAKEWVTESAAGGLVAVPTKLALMTALRQFLIHPALIGVDAPSAMFAALKEELLTNEEPVVIYSPYNGAFDLLDDMLDRMKWSRWLVKGGMSAQKMSASVQAFQLSKSPTRVLMVNLFSAISFTATAASHSYTLGWDWSPDVLTQAEDRVHRFGQQNFVLNTYFTHKGTVDQHQQKVLDRKESWSRLVLDPQLLLHPAWSDAKA
jgi:SWI/SNF-related matrix-associated actin-dependent regulator 1 of chromatin subfamily A